MLKYKNFFLLWPLSIGMAALCLWMPGLALAQGIHRIALSDSLIHLDFEPATTASLNLQLAAMEAFDDYEAQRNWMTDDRGGVLGTSTEDVLTMTFTNPAPDPFDPKMTQSEPVQADHVNQFAAQMRIRGYTGSGDVPMRLFVFDGVGGIGRFDFSLPADNLFRTVRTDLSSVTLNTTMRWEGERTLRLDVGEGEDYADYANAVLEIDWIAVTDNPLYSGGRNYTSFDRFWDLGFPVPVWTGTAGTSITLDRFSGGIDRLYSKFQLADMDFNKVGDPAWVTDLSGLSYVTEDSENWTVGSGVGGGSLSVNAGILTMDFVSGSPFDPQLVNSMDIVETDSVGEFAMRFRLVNYGGADATIPLAIYAIPYQDAGASAAFAGVQVNTGDDWQVVRVNLADELGADWRNRRTLRIDIPNDGTASTDFLSTEIEVDWIAMTDDSNFTPGNLVKAPSLFWDFMVDRNFALPKAQSKKGLDGAWLENHLELGTKINKRNYLLQNLMDTSNSPQATAKVNGIDVGYKPSYIRTFAGTARPMTEAGMVIFTTVLNLLPSEIEQGDPLINIRSVPGSNPQSLNLGAFNLNDPKGVAYYVASLQLMTSAFSYPDGRNGIINNFIIGNELDQHWAWHNMGEIDEDGVAEHYSLALRLADLAVRSVHPEVRVYTSFTHHWSHFSGGNPLRATPVKSLLHNINDRIKAEGDFPWQMAYHPYPQSLLDPEFWLDTDATFDLDTQYITYKNLEVLPQAFWLSDMRYNGRELRNIALTEQGFHTLSTTDGQQIQAAALAYGWHRIKQIDGIGHYIHHRDVDHTGEAPLKAGLWTEDPATEAPSDALEKKPAWSVFQVADTDDWQTTFSLYLPYLPFDNWEDADPRPGAVQYLFETDGDSEGWQATSHIVESEPTVAGGFLECESAGADPFLTTGDCYFVTEFRDKILIRMAVDGGTAGELFWRRLGRDVYAADQKHNFPVTADGAFHIYELDLSADANWAGQEILGLRLDPTSVSGVTIQIDYILAGDSRGDFDLDGLPDSQEREGDADEDGLPNIADTDSDGDGYSDGEEAQSGSNPYNPYSTPANPFARSSGHWMLY